MASQQERSDLFVEIDRAVGLIMSVIDHAVESRITVPQEVFFLKGCLIKWQKLVRDGD
jgi:hypothetical protein